MLFNIINDKNQVVAEDIQAETAEDALRIFSGLDVEHRPHSRDVRDNAYPDRYFTRKHVAGILYHYEEFRVA